jgi:5-methylthioadenosine/S-adenosylhomocysteine deaminase
MRTVRFEEGRSPEVSRAADSTVRARCARASEISEERRSSKVNREFARPARMRNAAVLAAICAALAIAARPAAGTETPHAPSKKNPSASTRVDLLVTARHVLTMDAADRVLSPGGVAVLDGKIVAVGPPDDLEARFRPKERISRPAGVVMPGLVNTHTHAAMCLMRGIADDEPLMDWLRKSIFPAEARNVSPDFVRAGTTLACAEMIRGGTTTFADMYYYETDVATAVEACGLRAVLGETWLDSPAPGHATLGDAEKVTRAFLEKWKGNGRIIPAVAPHAPYTCSKETLLAAKFLADEFGAPILIHVSETKDEQKQIREKYGKTPVQWLESIGFLSPRVVAAHGVWLDAGDLRILAERKVALSHNPESNMKLGSGVAPAVSALQAGVTVGLGTDGVAGSNDDLDMWESMDFAGKLAKVTALDPTVLPARELLRMATIEGAKALGLETVTGSLEPGKAADLIAVDLGTPRTSPVYDVASTLVYAAKQSDVSLTIVDGVVLWDGRSWRTVDVPAALLAAGKWREKIRRSLSSEDSR